MPSPIQRVVGQVFVPVRDMEQAISWYASLLGFDPGTPSHEGTILDIASDVEDIGSVSFVQFDDPDGNALMVCRRT